MQSIGTVIIAITILGIATPLNAQTCADRLSLTSSMSDTINCARELATKLETSEGRLRSAEIAASSSKLDERRFSCAKLALNVAKQRLDANREYVALAAGTYANHSVRNGMLLEWRNSKIPSVDEKISEVCDYLNGARNGC